MHNDKQLSQLAEPHHRGEAREIAAIDLGSNSFHMIVATDYQWLDSGAVSFKTKSEARRRLRRAQCIKAKKPLSAV